MRKKNKNKSYLPAVLCALMIAFFILTPVSVLASGDVMWDSYEKPSSRQKDRFVDAANLLSESSREELQEEMDALSEKWNCNIVILTVQSHTGYIQDYADDYFDYNGFQADYPDGSGVLFMLSMEDREWAISTCGKAIGAFTDYGQEKMMDKMMPDLSEGYYYSAFETYIKTADRYLELYENGTPFDYGSKNVTESEFLKGIIICIIIGLILGAIPVVIMIGDLTNVHANDSAAGYQAHNGINMKFHKDTYLRSAVSKTPIPKDNDSRGSGGSSVHTSSSGSSHGGSHGHF
jgi:uncharacterized protein